LNIINLTPHPLVLETENSTITIESSGIARCKAIETEADHIDGVPIVTTQFGAVTGLPDPAPDVVYVVSSITAQAVPDRQDVFVPARLVRDDKGRIVACRAFGRIDGGGYHCRTCANSCGEHCSAGAADRVRSRRSR
jgi:hypothetical protein